MALVLVLRDRQSTMTFDGRTMLGATEVKQSVLCFGWDNFETQMNRGERERERERVDEWWMSWMSCHVVVSSCLVLELCGLLSALVHLGPQRSELKRKASA